jgi:hypothetical protein
MNTEQLTSHRISEHARSRLGERTSLADQDVLELLRRGIYRRLHTRYAPSLPQSEIDRLLTSFNCTFAELKEKKLVEVRELCRHLLIWSLPDCRPLTLIIGKDKTVITVLFSDDFSSHDWSDIVTPEILSEIQAKTARAQDPHYRRYELHARWLDFAGNPKFKTFKNPQIISLTPLTPSVEELEGHVRLFVKNGRGVELILRCRKDASIIVLEKFIGEVEANDSA